MSFAVVLVVIVGVSVRVSVKVRVTQWRGGSVHLSLVQFYIPLLTFVECLVHDDEDVFTDGLNVSRLEITASASSAGSRGQCR
jgi:hypothetical protein